MRQTPGVHAYVISGVEERWLGTSEVLAGLGIQAQRVVPVKPSPKLAEREFSVRTSVPFLLCKLQATHRKSSSYRDARGATGPARACAQGRPPCPRRCTTTTRTPT